MKNNNKKGSKSKLPLKKTSFIMSEIQKHYFSKRPVFTNSKLWLFRVFSLMAFLGLITFSFFAQQTKDNSIPQTVHGNLGKQIDVYLSRAAQFGFSGQVLISKDSKIILHKGYGAADRSGGISTTLTTKFGIASMSKMFAAAAILKLEDEGKLSVKDPIAKYIPNLPEDKNAISIHQILTHISGMRGGFSEDFEAISREELLQKILSEPIVSEPDKGWRYSSEAYTLLAIIVENISGLAYEDFMETKIFQPAGMINTGFWHSKFNKNNVSHAYVGWDDKGSPATWFRNWRVMGGGDIVSTAEDLYRWEIALRKGTILSADAVKRYMMPHVKIRDNDFYAYGLFVGKTPRNTTIIEHGGDTEIGFNGVFFRWVDEDTVLIITCNSRDHQGRSMRQSIQGDIDKMLFENKPVSLPPDATPIVKQIRFSVAGTYSLDSGKIHLIDDGYYFWLAAENQQLVNLFLGTESEVASMYQQVNERTSQLINGLRQDEQKAFETALTNDGISFIEDYLQEWNDLQKTYGPLRNYKILGTITQRQAVITYARLQFRDRQITMTFRWLDGGKGRLSGTDPKAAPFPIIVCLASSVPKGDLIGYDLFQEKHFLTLKQNSKTNDLQLSFPNSAEKYNAKKIGIYIDMLER